MTFDDLHDRGEPVEMRCHACGATWTANEIHNGTEYYGRHEDEAECECGQQGEIDE